MNSHLAIRHTLVPLLLLLITSAAVQAVPPVRHRAVDVFSLHDGTRLLGVSLTPTEDGSQSVLMNASWLKQQYPVLFQQLEAGATNQPVGKTDLADRIKEYLEELRSTEPDQIERIGYLQERLIDIEANGKEQTTTDLVLVEVSESVIRRQLLQKREIRKIGQLALLNGIPNVETISATDVNSALAERARITSLRMSMPTSVNKSSESEFLRLLISSERMFGEPCRLIQFAGRFVSADDETAAVQKLLPDMLQGQIQKQLSDLLGQPKSKIQKSKVPGHGTVLDSAAAVLAAERKLVEVTRLDLDPGSGTATVSVDVYFKVGEASEFRLFASVSGNASTRDISQEQLQRINNDPRVRQVTQLFGSLGAGSANLSKAVSMGAVVEVAQNSAKTAMAEQFSNGPVQSAGGLGILRAKLSELPTTD